MTAGEGLAVRAGRNFSLSVLLVSSRGNESCRALHAFIFGGK